MIETGSLAGKRVLVTGGAGFLGRVVCDRIKKLQPAELIFPRRADADLTDRPQVAALFDDARPEIVLHLAAEVGGIGANMANPGRYFYANLAMGLNVIEESRIAGVEKVVQVGTVCSYPKRTPVPFSEDDLWDGYPEETNAPYGIAKKSLLVMLRAYRDQYGLNGIFLLPSNLYGPGDNFDPESSHVIPALIRKILHARDAGDADVEVWGSGEPSREFLYVDDAARGIVEATEGYDGAEPVNLGTGREITIRRLAALIAELAGYRGEFRWNRSKPDGQPRRSLDVSRARVLFGFEADVSLEEGLARTIRWWEARQ